MARRLHLLLIEDSTFDTELELAELTAAGYDCTHRRVQTREELAAALAKPGYDLILSDYSLPGFDGMTALRMIRGAGLDTPFVLVSGILGEERAIEALKAGATDFVLKTRLARLEPVVARALSERDEHRKRRHAEQALHEANRRLRALSRRLIETQEADRRHLAQELHDEIGQGLTALKLQLQRIAQQTQAPDLEPCVAIVDQMLSQVRSLALDLRPPQLDELGLEAALHSLVERLAHQTGMDLRIETAPDLPRLGPALSIVCFRVAQEALTNALRHASAHQICVSVHADRGGLSLRVRDDGCGFDPVATRQSAASGASMGLVSMHERIRSEGGFMDIVSDVQGTEIRAWLPLPRAVDLAV